MSSVAMNRRISRDSRNSSSTFSNNDFSNNNSNTEPLEISGTPSQKLYRIATFHEKRLNQVFDQVHVLTSKLNRIEPETNLRLHRLEQENASLRKQIASLMSSMSSSDNSVSLNIDENA